MNAEQARMLFLDHCPPGVNGSLASYGEDAAVDALIKVTTYLEGEARRYASHYPQGSDGRNTFLMLADRAENMTAEDVFAHFEAAHD